MNLTSDFNEFWYRYPRRVGKLAAIKAYTKARKLASAADIVQGIETYITNKPTWQEWAHPSSWLNAGRWMDEVRPVVSHLSYEWHCPHTPTCPHRAACVVVAARGVA